jgi:Cupin-like domain
MKATTHQWFIVSQVKSHRVVYFTDDENYQPPTEGDWYMVSPFLGDLPEGLTLKNCWGWRFNGMAFEDAREYPIGKPTEAASLLRRNQDLLLKILREKIEAQRSNGYDSGRTAEQLRQVKLEEARHVFSESGETAMLRLLPTLATLNNKSMKVYATELINEETDRVSLMVESELVKEEFIVLIEAAKNNDELIVLRTRVMSEISPDKNQALKRIREHTTPTQFNAKLTDSDLHQEKARLSVQLRLKINSLRREFASDYILDDVVLQHKGRLARMVVNASSEGEKLPDGHDFAPLVSYAASRGINLLAAAHDVLKEIDDTARALIDSEQLKDALMYRVMRIASFEDIEVLSKAISSLSLRSNEQPVQKKLVGGPDRSVDALSLRRKTVLSQPAKPNEAIVVARYPKVDIATMKALAKKGLPFVVQGLVTEWPIAKLTTKEFLKRYGDLKVTARTGDYVASAFSGNRTFEETTIAQFMAQSHLVEGNAHEPPPYLGNQALPQITAECMWPELFEKAAEAKVWLGPKNTITPLHCDYDDNLFAQVWGKKMFHLYPPWNADLLYLKQANPVLYASGFNPEIPDFDQFPLARDAHRVQCELHPGELMFLPAGWFHYVRAASLSLSANLWGFDQPYAGRTE